MKAFLHRWPPSALVSALRPSRRPREAIRFTGDYATWGDALRDSSGYQSSAILERTREALRAVRDGRALFERDSVPLDTPESRAILAEALTRGIPWVIVNLPFFHHGPADRPTGERVPAWIYPASYPAWFLRSLLACAFSSRL